MNNLFDLWSKSAAQYPHRLALLGNQQQVTYQDADIYIQEASTKLQQIGVGESTKVALFFGNEPNFVIVFFAIVKLGAIACPLNPNLTMPELEKLVNTIQPDVAIFGTGYSILQQHLSKQILTLEMNAWSLADPLNKTISKTISHEPELDEVACILCTSGTTGLPKAAMLTHTNLCSNTYALWANKNWLDAEIFGNALPVFHIYGITVLTLLPILMGGTVVFMPKFSPESCLKTIEQYKITRFGGVPSMFVMLNKFRYIEKYDISSCQSWISGGAPLAGSVVDEFFEKFGHWIYEGYGMLETSPGISWNLDDSDYHKGSVGRPLKGVEVKISYSLNSQEISEQTGEIWVKSLGVMKGYYRNPLATEEVIANGYLKTGDIGRLDQEGYLYLMGRVKDVIIVGGHNIYPREVESVLLEDSTVSDTAVIGIDDPIRGEQIFAFVVALGNSQIDEQALLQRCRKVLSPFKIPRRIYCIPQIPRNDSGKTLKANLRNYVTALRE